MMRTNSYSLFFAALTLTLFLFSCHDEEVSNPLLGTWKLVDIYNDEDVIGKNYGGSLTDTTYYTYTYQFDSSDFTYTFSEDPNEVVSNGQLTYLVNLTYDGHHETYTETFNGATEPAQWEINKDKLKVSFSSGQFNRTIDVLTTKTLRYREDINEIMFQNGGVLHIKGVVYTVFEKQ